MSKYYLASHGKESTRSIPVIEVYLDGDYETLADAQQAVKALRIDMPYDDIKWMVAKVFEKGEML